MKYTITLSATRQVGDDNDEKEEFCVSFSDEILTFALEQILKVVKLTDHVCLNDGGIEHLLTRLVSDLANPSLAQVKYFKDWPDYQKKWKSILNAVRKVEAGHEERGHCLL